MQICINFYLSQCHTDTYNITTSEFKKFLNINTGLLWVTLHEVPQYTDPLNVSVMEGVVVGPVTIALYHLLALVTPGPQLAVEPVVAVHVGGVREALGVTVHVLEDLVEMDHLDMIVVAIVSNGCVVGALPEVAGTLGGERDPPVIEAVEVDDVDRRVWHGIVASEWRAAYWSYGGQRGRESGQGPGPDKHTWVG